MPKTYKITATEIVSIIKALDDGNTNDKLAATVILQKLPELEGEPVAWTKNSGVIPDVGTNRIDINFGDGTVIKRVLASEWLWQKHFTPYIHEWKLSDTHPPAPLKMLDDDEFQKVWIECSDPQQDEIVMSEFSEKIQQAFCTKNNLPLEKL